MFDIPKDINAKPKLLGLEIKELIFFVIAILMIMTVFKDMVHKVFTIPYYVVSFGLLLYLILPSINNSDRKNYHSIIYFFKKDKIVYSAIDIRKEFNESMQEEVIQQNASIEISLPKNVFDEYKDQICIAKQKQEERELLEMEKQEKHVIKTKNEVDLDQNIEQNNTEHKQENKLFGLFKKKKVKKPLIAIASLIIIGLVAMGVKSGFSGESALAEQDDVSKQDIFYKEALMSSAVKEYNDASIYLDKVNYKKLNKDEQEVMLKIYLYASKPEKAVALEQGFDEEVANYYVGLEDKEKLEELAKNEDFKTAEFEYQVAKMNGDNPSIIKFKDNIKLNKDKNATIVNALLAEKEFKQAKRHIEENDLTSEYETKINDAEKKHEEEQKAKKEKEEKAKKEKEKKDKKDKKK